MCFKICYQILVLLFTIVIYTGCITIVRHTPSPPPDPVDHSFSVTGEVMETGNVASVLERARPFSRAHPLHAADILLTGVVRQPLSIGITFLHTVKLKYQDDDTIWILPGTRKSYQWIGTVVIDGNSLDTEIDFHVYGGSDGSGKQFILRNALLGQTRLEADDPLDVYNSTTGSFPFLIGYAHLPDNSYRIFAVRDNFNYSDPWNFNKNVFYDSMQKFQLLNEENSVVAELEKGRYTIYDSLPETELEGIKQAIALLIGFRHSTSVLIDINDGWDPPMFYRYVYP